MIIAIATLLFGAAFGAQPVQAQDAPKPTVLDGVYSEAQAARGPTFNDSTYALQAAARGEGIALARRSIVFEDLEKGVLKRLFDITVPSRERYWFVSPKEVAASGKVRKFRDWVRAELKADGLA